MQHILALNVKYHRSICEKFLALAFVCNFFSVPLIWKRLDQDQLSQRKGRAPQPSITLSSGGGSQPWGGGVLHDNDDTYLQSRSA